MLKAGPCGLIAKSLNAAGSADLQPAVDALPPVAFNVFIQFKIQEATVRFVLPGND